MCTRECPEKDTEQPKGKDDLASNVNQLLSLTAQSLDNGLMNRTAMLKEMETMYGPNGAWALFSHQSSSSYCSNSRKWIKARSRLPSLSARTSTDLDDLLVG